MTSFFMPVTTLGRPFFSKREKKEPKEIHYENEMGVMKCDIAPRASSAIGIHEYGRVNRGGSLNNRNSLSPTHEFLKRGKKNLNVLQVEAPLNVHTLEVERVATPQKKRQTNWDSFAEEHNLKIEYDEDTPMGEIFSSPTLYRRESTSKEKIIDPSFDNLESVSPWSDIIANMPDKPTRRKSREFKPKFEEKKEEKKEELKLPSVSSPKRVKAPISEKPPSPPEKTVPRSRKPSRLEPFEAESGKDENDEFREQMSRDRKKYRPAKVQSITCTFMKIKGIVPIKSDTGFGDLDIQNVFNFSNHQILYLHIKGIKEKTGEKRMFPFITDPELPYMTCLDRHFLHMLRGDIIYQVVVEDLREKKVALLTLNETRQIREQFDEIDIDRSGELSYDEVKGYYDRQKARDIEKATNLSKIRMSMATDQDEIKYVIEQFNSRKLQLDRYYQGKVEIMMTKDTLSRGCISWDEFLLHEAVEKIRIRKASEANSTM
jgi:hypothetical protein